MVLACALVAPLVRAAVACHAVPPGQPWRQRCDHCGTTLRYPWLSTAFWPPGRCPGCRHRVGAPGYAVEVAAVLAALVVMRRPAVETIAFGWWAACAVALGWVDVMVHRLPDRLTYPAAVGTLALLGVAALVEHHTEAFVRALVAGGGSGLVFAGLTVLLGRRGPGLGDAKLMVSTFAMLGWISWSAVVGGFLLAFTAQALWAVALLATRRATRSTHLPLGPFLISGALVSLGLMG